MRNKIVTKALALLFFMSLHAHAELSFGLTYLVPEPKAQVFDNLALGANWERAEHRVWHNIKDTFNDLFKKISVTFHHLAR